MVAISEREPLEVDGEDGRQSPDDNLLRGFSMLLALGAIPILHITQ